MASQGVSGWLPEEIEEKRAAFEERHADDDKEFDETYCLAKIPVQPDDYDGPQRYCGSPETIEHGSGYVCHHHGGARDVDDLEKLASMTHGLRSLRKHIRETFDEKDEAIYKWVTEEYPDAYDISIEESPADAYDVHRLAVEIVRAERGRGHVLQEGEIHEDEKVGENGIVLDENGEVVTEKSSHYLAKMLADQDRKITRLQKELGISRKERQKAQNADEAVEAVKNLTDLGSAFLDRDSQDYDASDEPWTDDDTE